MKGGSWASYQAALPIEARAGGEPDDEPTEKYPTGPPSAVIVAWFEPVEWDEEMDGVMVRVRQDAPVGRWFSSESWAWKHIMAWKAAMERRHGHAWIEEVW